MKYSDIKLSINAQFSIPGGNKTAFFIMGAPGGGKSACSRETLLDLGFTPENTVEFVASLRDPVDVLGVPETTGDYTRWVPPEEFWKLRQGVGRCALLLEELSDAPVPMQNALCSVIYDRRAGQLQLSDDLYIIATGNRTKDKSGANRVTSKLAGRTRLIEFQEDMKELCAYAIRAGWPDEVPAFFHFRPGLISDFDPSRFANPTPRTWEDVIRIPAGALPEGVYFDNVAGAIGEGAAAEYIGFKKIWHNLPPIAGILKDPLGSAVPSDLATKYALMGALANQATADNLDKVVAYINRFEPEFSVMAMWVIVRKTPAVMSCRAFSEWASKHADVLM